MSCLSLLITTGHDMKCREERCKKEKKEKKGCGKIRIERINQRREAEDVRRGSKKPWKGARGRFRRRER